MNLIPRVVEKAQIQLASCSCCLNYPQESELTGRICDECKAALKVLAKHDGMYNSP